MKGKAAALSKHMTIKSNSKPTRHTELSSSHYPSIISHQNSEPKKPSPICTSSENVLIQRKTAVLNKDNCAQSRTLVPVTKNFPKAVLCAQQNVRPKARNIIERGHQSRSNKQYNSEQKVASDVSKERLEGQVQLAENSFDVWLKERGESWEKEQQRECVELGEFELLERAAHEFSFSSNSSFLNTLLRRDGRRLSSTPVKSPPKYKFPDQDCDYAAHLVQPVISRVVSPPVLPVDTEVAKDKKRDESDQEEEAEESESSLCSNTVFYQSTAEPHLQEPFSHDFKVSSLPYDKRSYQDQDGVTTSENEETPHVDSTLVEVRGQVEFDDDDTWNEPDESIHSPPKLANLSQGVSKRKVAFSLETEADRHTDGLKLKLTPTCQLVAKLFPSLKPQSCQPTSVQDAADDTEQGAGKRNP